MSNAITMEILAFDWRGQCSLFLRSVQKSKKMVMGNHVVSRWDCFVDYSAVGHQRPVTTGFLAYYSSFSLSTLLPVFLFGAMWGLVISTTA